MGIHKAQRTQSLHQVLFACNHSANSYIATQRKLVLYSSLCIYAKKP
ncbi:hypothetical protein HMPREF3232_01023 [Fannyhessea vaginae]|nr:hypothetical protein HMPREF3232_01023 [Fannyhessea vaginae]